MHVSDFIAVMYAVLVLVWALIIVLYIRYYFKTRIHHKTISLLIIIITIDAFRTLFESVYFGVYFSSSYEFITNSILYQPSLLIVPKLINLASALLIIFLLIRHWIPSLINNELKIKKSFDESERRRKFALDAANIGD